LFNLIIEGKKNYRSYRIRGLEVQEVKKGRGEDVKKQEVSFWVLVFGSWLGNWKLDVRCGMCPPAVPERNDGGRGSWCGP